jgi:hypothetical protein
MKITVIDKKKGTRKRKIGGDMILGVSKCCEYLIQTDSNNYGQMYHREIDHTKYEIRIEE